MEKNKTSLEHVTIKTKLIAGFGLLSCIVVAVFGLSLKALSDSTDGFSSYVHGSSLAGEAGKTALRRCGQREPTAVLMPAASALHSDTYKS